MEWLIDQAKTASPFVAMFCLLMCGLVARVLWKQHQDDQKAIKALNIAYTKAMTATARALEKIAAAVERGRKARS